MAVVTLDKKELKKIIGNLSNDKIDNFMGLFSTAVEKISENEVEVEVAPNRPDMLSQQGIFRALRSYLGKKTGAIKYKINKPEKDYTVKIDSSVKEVRPYTTCAIVKNLSLDNEKIKEIIDIQEKLHSSVGRNRKKVAIGIYPLEKISLPITYKAESPEKIKFIPLEYTQEMTGRQVLNRTATGREHASLLKDSPKFPVFEDSKGEVLSMPPIINSHRTGKIEKETGEVFIECSGHDLEIQKKVLNILVTTFADMGGEIYAMNLQYGNKKLVTPDFTPEKMKINLENVNRLLGVEIKETDVKKGIEKMGYSYNKKEVEIPAYRTDILHENDLIEDIAIAYGYDNFVPEIPEISTIGEETEGGIKKRKISDILAGLGFLEISSYHLTTKKDAKKTNYKSRDFIQVEDSKTEYDILRPSLLISCCRVLSENSDSSYPQKIFETGKVFENKEGEIKEKEKLAIAISGETDFTEIKQTLDYLMRSLEIEYKIQETEYPGLISGRAGKIVVNGKEIGVLGELSPYVLKNWHLKMPAVVLEIEIGEI